MLSRIRDRNIWIVNATILLVGLSSGMAISMLAVYLNRRGYTKTDIGWLAAIFASGIAVSAVLVGRLSRTISPKTVLVGSLFLYAVTLALFPPAVAGFHWIAIDRVFDGAASAGIWVSCETILLSRAEYKNKAFVTSIYATAIAIGYLIGPFASRGIVVISTMTVAFEVAAALLAVTAVVVAVKLERDPPGAEHKQAVSDAAAAEGLEAPPSSIESTIGNVLWRIKCSLFGNFAYGYFQASMVLYLPLYMIASKGVEENQTIMVPGFFALGMLLFVIPAGLLGDRFGHLAVMRVLGVVGATTGLMFVFLQSFWLMCALVSVAGATLASISPISLALQGVILGPRDIARGNASYNGIYAVGMLIGPLISSVLFQLWGGEYMMYHLAALWAAFVIFALIFANDDPRRRARRLEAGAPVSSQRSRV